MANAVGFGYVRIEQSTNPNSLIFSGILLNVSGLTTNLTINISFDGVSGSFQTASFALPVGETIAFSLSVGVAFANSHSGTLTVLSGSTQVDQCSFISDAASQDLGFQNVIIGHVMPDVVYPNLPSVKYPMAEEVT